MIWVENFFIEVFIRENKCMVAYIFRADNTVTGKHYFGKRYSVKFDKSYIGDNPGVILDAEKYGKDKFTVQMVVACETVKECDRMYESILEQFNVKNDESWYNFEGTVEEKPKRTRKKKVVE